MEEHVLDLTKRLWSFSKYGLTAVGTWVQIDHRWRPCMAIVKNSGPMRPCVITLEDAWKWSDVIGEPVQHAIPFLLALGVNPSPENVNKLIDLVNSRMADLVELPPRPDEAQEHAAPLADITIKNDLTGTTEVSL